MIHATKTRALKTLLLGSTALVIAGLQPAISQDRPQSPSQNTPAASPALGNQPAAGEHRPQQSQAPRSQESQRGAPGQGGQEQRAPDRDGNREAQSPKGERQPAQTRDNDRARDNHAQPRDSERDRAQDRNQDRDRNQVQDKQRSRDRDQVRDRDSDRNQDQARDRDNERSRDLDQARDRDKDRNRDRDQARDRDPDRNRDQARDGASVNDRQVTEQQRTRISTSIRQANVQPVRNVNFSVSIGVAVPASVRFYPVTPAIVEIYPEYRGYEFVLVEDDIVIVEPRSRKIVRIIDHGGSGRAAAAPSRSKKLTLTQKQRDVIRSSAMQRRTTGSGRAVTIDREVEVGDDLPETLEFESFPETIYTEIPEIRSYRYIVRDRDIYLVEPGERRVIEIIR